MKPKSIQVLKTSNEKQPRAVFGIDDFLLAVTSQLVVSYGAAGAMAIYKALKNESPFFIQIIDSFYLDEYYYIDISFKNITESGIYIEKVWISKPRGFIENNIYVKEFSDRMSFGNLNNTANWISLNQFLPIYFNVTNEYHHCRRFSFRFKDQKTKNGKGSVLGEETNVEISFEYASLNKTKIETKKIEILLRKNNKKN